MNSSNESGTGQIKLPQSIRDGLVIKPMNRANVKPIALGSVNVTPNKSPLTA